VKKKLHNLQFKKDIELTKEINKISNKRDFALNIRLRKYCTNSIPKLLQKIDNEDVVRETQTNMKEINTFLKKYYYNDFDGIVLNFKVQRSVELLSRSKENKYNLSQISEACGFKDTQEYHRYFHKIIGVSPGEYREVLYSNQKKNKVEKIKMNLQ
jgi:AraC-like DNA-binding protein